MVTVCLFVAASPALAASRVWHERGDAGSLPTSAQVVSGIGPVASIVSRLSGPADEDMYRICITGGKSFSATTVHGAMLDTQLFMFDRHGKGVYANDDSRGTLQSTLPAGHRLTPQAGGKYFLAISSFDNDAVSAGGLIFPSFPFSAVVGPTGPGGNQPVADWTDEGSSSDPYTIRLTGARSCAGPTTAG